MNKFIIILFSLINITFSQVGIGTTTPASTSLLDVTSTSKGVLVPRMTTTQKANISSPATGLLIYQTDGAAGFYYYSGSAWILLTNNLTTKVGGANFTEGILIGHATTGILNNAFNNTGVGSGTLNSITSGDNNSAIGYNSLNSNTTGSANTAIGYQALQLNTIGHSNTSIGADALFFNTSGTSNTAIGSNALLNNSSGSVNTAIGVQSLYFNNNGNFNVAIGYQPLYSFYSGANNTAVGGQALLSLSQGNTNVGLGFGAGYSLTSGDNNIIIGYNAEASNTVMNNEITLGNGSIATLRCQVTSITALSDKRDKTKITTITEGIDFIKKLNPVIFEWNTRDKAKVGIKAAGFIAQELLELQTKSKIGEHLDLVSTENPEKLEARYSNLLPVLVKAIQEQQDQIQTQNKMISELKDEVKKLKSKPEKDYSSKE